MTKEEARIIFKSWQDYVEIADKLHKLFCQVPESFLPYPVHTLEEALNITAKDYFDSGNKEMSETIQRTMALYLTPYYFTESGVTGIKFTDEESIELMKRKLDLIENNPELKKAIVKSLKETQDSWIKSRNSSGIA